MRKGIVLILTLAFLFSLICGLGAVGVSPSIRLTVSEVSGDQITVQLRAEGMDWVGLSVQLLYDPSRLTLLSAGEGTGIAAARQDGFSFLCQSGDPAQSSQTGRCAFVAATGAKDCAMSRYDSVAAVFVFRLTDLAIDVIPVQLAVASLLDVSGVPLLEYTGFTPDQPPVVYGEYSLPTYEFGDVNGDGELTVYDALLLLQNLAGSVSLTPRNLAAGKVAGQADLTVYDALLILQRLAGAVDTFPAA